jgi:hypothetical protein
VGFFLLISAHLPLRGIPLLFSPPNPPKGGLIRQLIAFLLSSKFKVIKKRYLSPRRGDASQREAGGFYIYSEANTLGGKETLIAVRRAMPSNLFWKLINILEVSKSFLFISFAPPKEMNKRKGGRK